MRVSVRRKPHLLLSLGVIVVGAWALLSTGAWPAKAALFPRIVAIPLLVLAVAEFLLSLTHEEQTEGRTVTQGVDFQLSEVDPSVALPRTISIFAWILGFFVAIILIGFPRAIPLFVFLYLKIEAKEGWLLSLLLSGAAWGLFYLLFVRLLPLPFSPGRLFL